MLAPMAEPSTLYRRSTNQVSCNLDEEVAVLDLVRSRYYGLEGVAAHIWSILEEPRSVEQICTSVVDQFDVSEDDCRRDIGDFLASLQAAGLLEQVE
jgi:hypothetical protein